MKSNWLKLNTLGAAVALIAACGGSGQDDGTATQFEQTLSGLVIDGYLARSTVYLDTNNDGRRNAWEPFAFTDNEGYYSYNPNTDTDYCAAAATVEQAQYCLRTNVRHSDVVVRVDGGYDVQTGEPFVGQLSRRVSDPSDDTIISPITSLLSDVRNTDDQSTVLNSLGLESADLDVNYLNADGAGGIDAGILNAAIKVHKVVAVLSDRVTDTYTEIGSEVGTPNGATSAVYRELASQLTNNGLNFDETIADTTALATVLDDTENAMREIYQTRDLVLPTDMGTPDVPTGFSRVIQVSNNIVNVVNQVIDPSNIGVNLNEVVGQTRAIESVVIKALEETNTDTSIENAAAFFTNSGNAALIDSLVQSLSENTADLTALARNDFAGTDFDSEEEITSAVQLPEGTAPFMQIGGMQIRVSDLDLGNAPSDVQDAEVEWYFSGEADALSGAFTACVKFIDDANVTTGRLGDGNTRGELVDGFWSLLGATEERRESYSLLITLTFLGATYQAIMKPAGTETINQTSYQRVRVDTDGELNVWHSADGLVEVESVPTTNAECIQRLPSRVGL